MAYYTLVAILSSTILAGHAILATGTALLEPPPCRMVLVVTAGVITAFDCQGGVTECDAQSMDCWKVMEGTEDEPIYHCRCCEPPDHTGCAGTSEHQDFCTVTIRVPYGQNPVMQCTDTGHCNNQTCPTNPTPVTGVATCPCQ